jgi:type IV secretion system protein VirB2
MQPKQNLNCLASGQLGAIDYWRILSRLTVIAIIAAPALAMAAPPTVSGTEVTDSICNVLTIVQTVLNTISVMVVTIAIIFSGYQIAFAHKRIAEVAPIFIGGLLIGAASQIAGMLIQNTTTCH